MKDSQHVVIVISSPGKYIKANNERFSTIRCLTGRIPLSISRRIMKDSQLYPPPRPFPSKYIKANNERFSTVVGSGARRG